MIAVSWLTLYYHAQDLSIRCRGSGAMGTRYCINPAFVRGVRHDMSNKGIAKLTPRRGDVILTVVNPHRRGQGG